MLLFASCRGNNFGLLSNEVIIHFACEHTLRTLPTHNNESYIWWKYTTFKEVSLREAYCAPNYWKSFIEFIERIYCQSSIVRSDKIYTVISCFRRFMGSQKLVLFFFVVNIYKVSFVVYNKTSCFYCVFKVNIKNQNDKTIVCEKKKYYKMQIFVLKKPTIKTRARRYISKIS